MHSAKVDTAMRTFEVMKSTDEKERNGAEDDLKEQSSRKDLIDFSPRRYQRKVFDVAMRRNTIAVLETGAGKTMIAVMLINDVGRSIKSSGLKKLIIFLAPTVHLVQQQFEVIKAQTTFEVGKYYGAMGVDEWNSNCWAQEINEHDVLVMTPAILLAALRKAFLGLEMVGLIIFDECHRATGNHYYTRIMKEFYHKCGSKPKIFGMTASPVVRKGVSSVIDCEDQLSELESILDSQIYTIEDRTELDVYVPAAKEINKFYDSSLLTNLDLKTKLAFVLSEYEGSLSKLQESPPSLFKDIDENVKAVKKRISNEHAKILHCLDDLGLAGAYEAVKVCIENDPNAKEGCELYRQSCLQRRCFLEETLCLLGKSLPNGSDFLLDIGSDFLKAVKMGYLSPKLHELFQIFQSFGEARQVLCLIFVDRIITAKVVERIMKKLAPLSHFTFSYLTGSNSSIDGLSPQLQKKTLESFRSGKVNLLFTTDVIEEGIHVPECSCVIRFDLPKTIRSYIQSRGRARQSDSQFVMMLERGNKRQRDQLFDIILSEYSMKQKATSRDPDVFMLKACTVEEKDAYFVDLTGASVTTDSSVSLIHRYCEKLPGDKYYTPRPNFQFSLIGGLYECKLTLPPNSVFQTLVGPVSKSSHLSKQLVCLEACKKLHQMGALDDHLLPYVDNSENNPNPTSKESALAAGTTKRKELHGITCIRALAGTWGDTIDGAVFYAYKIDFSCNVVGNSFSGFVLLLESKLDEDVANVNVELYLTTNRLVKSSVSSCGQIHLDSEQVMKAKCFHELFFNGLFGRLFVGSKSSGKKREFLLLTENKSLWSPSNMYLVLPTESLESTNHESCNINWKGITSCASIVEVLKNYSQSSMENNSSELVEIECTSKDMIQLANISVPMDNLKYIVVLAIHTGKIYSILDVLTDSSAESPFDGNSDSAPSKFATFAEYFNKKYGIILKHPKQPLVLLKQSHNPHNLLVDFNTEDASSGNRLKAGGKTTERIPNHIHMPPELLVAIDVPLSVLKSFYLLPSLMHRLESLMLASQLREEIAFYSSDCRISSSLILEALTTLRCCENFSMERLELLGDSVLKYTVSCHLFLKYPKKHEGQLSALRSKAVCNANLHKLGSSHKLQGYIRDSPFDPRRWIAPGQQSIRPVPCLCGVDTLEVPLDRKFQTEDTKIVVGKCCDKGHRWMGSKTVADCVEALIGAYYVDGGLLAAVHLMQWLGIDAEVEPSCLYDAIDTASLRSCIPKANEIEVLESKLGYTFSVKGLLLEAMTHASEHELGGGYCYQRLEFLGDSVLDILITRHLYQRYEDVDPGELTDLRSASVNNENFAQVAVRRNLQQHLQHSSGLLLSQITEYVAFISAFDENNKSLQGTNKGPKALGDLVESIAGAILIDSKLNLEEVWRIFEPLLSPIVTPDNLELPPLRELNELCDSLGYFVKETLVKMGEMVQAELRLQLKDVLLVGEGCDKSRKAAKAQAALLILKDLENRGISYSQCVSKRKKQGLDLVAGKTGTNTSSQTNEEQPSPQPPYKKQKTAETHCSDVSNTSIAIPVIGSIDLKKGGPRTSLYDLCKRLQWPMPRFTSTEHKSRSLIEFGDGSEKKEGFNSFSSRIVLHIPNSGVIELSGDHRADKKSSLDSAALYMLYELEHQGKLKICGS